MTAGRNDEILTRWNLEKILTNRVRGIDSNPDLLKEKKEVKKNIKENSIEIIESKNKLIYLKNNTNRDEGLVLLLISLIGCLISPLGLIIAPVVLKRNKATNTFYKGVIAASVICFTVSLFVSYGHFSNIFHWGGSTNVEYIEN